MNIVALTGNVAKIELKYTPSGTGIVNGTLAVRRDFKNKQGEYETDFINFVALGKVSEVIANHVNKGDKFGITGRLQVRTWDKENGDRQYFTEVVVNGFDFPPKQSSNNQQNKPQDNTDPFANDGQPIDLSDNDLPF